MSGPWDRPSSDADATWPREDAGSSGSASHDPGSVGAPGWDDWPAPPPPSDDYLIEEPLPPSSDPWAESWTQEEADAMLRGAGDESPASDDRWSAPPAGAWDAAPDGPPATDAPVGTDAPEPEWTPYTADTSRTEAAAAPFHQPAEELDGPDRPVVAPWTPEPDPWRMEPDDRAWSAPSPDAEPSPSGDLPPFDRAEPPSDLAQQTAEPQAAEPPTDLAQQTAEPQAAEPPAPPPQPPVPPVARWPSRPQSLPDWIAEPLPTEPEAARERPTASPSPEADADQDRARQTSDTPALSEPMAASEEMGRGGDADDDAETATDAEPQPGDVPVEESGSFWDSVLPWRNRDEPPTEPDAAAAPVQEPDPARPVPEELELQAHDVDAEEGDHGPTWLEVDTVDDADTAPKGDAERAPFEPRWPSTVPDAWSGDPEAPAGEGLSPQDGASSDVAADGSAAFVPIGGGLTYPAVAPDADAEAGEDVHDTAEPVGSGRAAAVEAEPEHAAAEPEPEPDPWSRSRDAFGTIPAEPEADPANEPTPDPEPEPVPAAAWAPRSDWSDGGESTRVLPTDWSASPPEPAAPSAALAPSAGPIRTRLVEPDVDDLDEDLAAPTIAEQAVPWLIGVILLLAGMVIVLLALIFAGDGSLGGSGSSPSPDPTLLGVPMGEPSTTRSPTPSAEATPTAEPTATPEATTSAEPAPQYGPLEMVYQGRSAALAPIYLLRRDFTVEDEPAVLAQDSAIDVRRFAWAPDGRVGAGLLADILVSIEPGQEKRRLGDGLSTITFGDDASTVYAVRITEDGSDDTATVLAIDFASGDTDELASVTYERSQVGQEAALAEAGFSDDGGAVRLFWMNDDTLRLWVLGAGAWTIAPSDGEVTELDGEPLPTLVAPNGRERIAIEVDDGTSTLTRLDMNDRPLASISVDGIASHLRWSPTGDRVAFTLGRSAPGGGILQDLFLWDMGNGDEPVQLTATGAAFGAEWLGSQPRWRE